MPLPPLPTGFLLDPTQSGVPPLPPGFALDQQPQASSLGVDLKASPSQQRIRDVSMNSAREAVAGIPDMFLNAPVNAWNIAKSIPSMLQGNLLPEQTPTPDFVRGEFQRRGWITPQAEPQTTGERYLSAGTQGAVAGVPGGLPGMAVGAASNLIGQGVSDATGSPALGVAANLATPYGMNRAQRLGAAAELRRSREPITATTEELRGAGYRMPPATTNPTLLNRILESIAGKAATQQDASFGNSKVTAKLIREELRMPPEGQIGSGITDQSLDALKEKRAQPYRDVAALPAVPPEVKALDYHTEWGPPSEVMGKNPPTPEQLVHEWKSVNTKKNEIWQDYQRNRKVETLDSYRAAQARLEEIDKAIQHAAVLGGKPELVPELRAAKKDYAQINDVQRALNSDRGEVNTIALARARERGIPLSGGLETAAKMGNTYPKASVPPEKIGSPSVDALISAIGGSGGGALAAGAGAGMTGVGAGALGGAAGIHAARWALRKALLSDAYQRSLGTPNLVARGAEKLPTTEASDALIRAYIQSLQGNQP